MLAHADMESATWVPIVTSGRREAASSVIGVSRCRCDLVCHDERSVSCAARESGLIYNLCGHAVCLALDLPVQPGLGAIGFTFPQGGSSFLPNDRLNKSSYTARFDPTRPAIFKEYFVCNYLRCFARSLSDLGNRSEKVGERAQFFAL